MTMWGKLKRRAYCWLRGLVRLPYGSVQVVQLAIAGEHQLVAQVPAEVFSTELHFGLRLCLRPVLEGETIALRLKNCTRERLEVRAAVFLAIDDNQRTMLPFPDFSILPEHERIEQVQSVVAGVIKTLIISLPEYVSKSSIKKPTSDVEERPKGRDLRPPKEKTTSDSRPPKEDKKWTPVN